MKRTEIILNCTETDQVDERGERQYVFNYVVNAEPGEALFQMLTDFLHQAPEWVAEHFALALRFNAEHDRASCPHCQAAAKAAKTLTFEQWKAELITVTARATGQSERSITIRDRQAKEWYDSGATPWQCFRENFDNDGD